MKVKKLIGHPYRRVPNFIPFTLFSCQKFPYPIHMDTCEEMSLETPLN